MDPIDQLLLGGDADASEHSTGHFAEQILHQVEPRTVRGHKYEYEALRHGVQIGTRFPGDMGGMVIQQQADLLVRRVLAVQLPEEADEVGALVRVADGLSDAPAVEIEAR